jgi:cell division protein FtsQ
MASNSNRRSGSSGRSSSRSRVVIGAKETIRVKHAKDQPHVDSHRHKPSIRSSSERAGTRVPRVSAAGQKVAKERRDDRDKRKRKVARRHAVGPVLAVLAVVGAVWGLVALWQAPIFTVNRVDVIGTQHLSRSDVLRLAAVPDGATLLRLPGGEISSRIEASPWVAQVHLSRRFPHGLAVIVVERVPVAMVDAGGAGQWLVSGDGHWMARRSTEPTGALVPIRDTPSLAPQPGAVTNSAELKNALLVATGISQQTRRRLQYISAVTVEKTMLVLKNQVQIFVGSADDIAKKDLIANSILANNKNVVYVNVRVPASTTFRGLTPADRP